MDKRILIVGGSLCGIAAAKRLRRLHDNYKIIIFDENKEIAVQRALLPYYTSNIITDREKLILETSEELKRRMNINVNESSHVLSININQKFISIKDTMGKIRTESYDYLLLSPGSRAIEPDIDGLTGPKVFILRNLYDADSIRAYVLEHGINNLAIITETYEGVQLAQGFSEKGKLISLIMNNPDCLLPFDDEITAYVTKKLLDNDINIIQKEEIKCLTDTENNVEIEFKGRSELSAQMVIWVPAKRPGTEFLKGSGLELSASSHIKVDRNMKTSADNVYSAGNAAEIDDFAALDKAHIKEPNISAIEAAISADNISGLKHSFDGGQKSFAIKIFDMTAAKTGSTECSLKKLQIPYRVVNTYAPSHEPGYPNATLIYLKLLFDDSGSILGAQSIGYESVEKRIDIISAVMRLGGKIATLKELELSFSPPYLSSKDVINTVGSMAEDVLNGMTKQVCWGDMEARENEKLTIIDVRTELECENGLIKGALNFPLEELRNRVGELTLEKEILLYCQYGVRGYSAERFLAQQGFNVRNLSGGYEIYRLLNKDISEEVDSEYDNSNNFFKDENKYLLDELIPSVKIDACGLSCPGPLLKVSFSMNGLNRGDVLKVTASDPGFYTDISAWCKRTNNKLIKIFVEKGIVTAYIEKNITTSKKADKNSPVVKDNKTMVIFSGDLDKAIASFIIANGAASMGKKVTMFFTFWGLNIIRKPKKIKLKKGLLEKMFGFFMPRGSKKLKLSKMNMLGIGGKLIRFVMKSKNIYSLEQLIKIAIENGVELIACQMSMEVMGIKKEELIEGVKIAGVGYYIGETEDSNLNLFI
ncbi:MAG: DsrE/DsrF/DrsH-like family protein [Bacillota bacterium]|nr:DsrE/DsrF/DrsH-like family protein [Bacillota bacterium]